MMAKKIAEENGYELQVYKIEWDGLIMAVQSWNHQRNHRRNVSNRRKKTEC